MSGRYRRGKEWRHPRDRRLDVRHYATTAIPSSRPQFHIVRLIRIKSTDFAMVGTDAPLRSTRSYSTDRNGRGLLRRNRSQLVYQFPKRFGITPRGLTSLFDSTSAIALVPAWTSDQQAYFKVFFPLYRLSAWWFTGPQPLPRPGLAAMARVINRLAVSIASSSSQPLASSAVMAAE